ncbi:enoyl-CoA hydratase [Pseudooceanicola sp.]|uniref:enoyl-CoA hydratase n=1 Tax=Pseudooceanicola sp. TaxID=1914328 RepID=UPI0035163D8F
MTDPIPTFAHCEITRDDRGVYTATIANAKSLNILGTPVIRSVTEAVAWIAGRTDARAMILRGSGDRAFVGGADIFEMATLEPASARDFISGLRDLCEAVRQVPVPTIARIPGHCLGGGLELAACCDIRLASSDAVFGMPEVRVGIPSVIHAALLPGLIGPGATNWLLLTGETVDAAQAREWGFVQFTCPPGELDALVERTVDPIVSGGPAAIRQQKALIAYWAEADLEDGIARSVTAFGAAFETDEPRRFMAPFLDRGKSRG